MEGLTMSAENLHLIQRLIADRKKARRELLRAMQIDRLL
jgi:hypothetical protein